MMLLKRPYFTDLQVPMLGGSRLGKLLNSGECERLAIIASRDKT